MTSTQGSTLFVRKATGLVRSWSVFDAFIYATFSINLITLGLYIFSQMYYLAGRPGAYADHQRAIHPVRSGSLRGDDRSDAALRRRLRLAEPHPGGRGGFCAGSDRLVVHPVAVGPAVWGYAAAHRVHAVARHCRGAVTGAVVRADTARPVPDLRAVMCCGDRLHCRGDELVRPHPTDLFLGWDGWACWL